MQQALILVGRPTLDTPTRGGDGIIMMARAKPVLVVGRQGCCMTQVAKRLLQNVGVNPAVCELGEDECEVAAVVESMVAEMAGGTKPEMLFPVLFIGGRLIGGLDRLMAVHISGELGPILKEAGAVWPKEPKKETIIRFL